MVETALVAEASDERTGLRRDFILATKSSTVEPVVQIPKLGFIFVLEAAGTPAHAFHHSSFIIHQLSVIRNQSAVISHQKST